MWLVLNEKFAAGQNFAIKKFFITEKKISLKMLTSLQIIIFLLLKNRKSPDYGKVNSKNTYKLLSWEYLHTSAHC